MTQTNEVGKVKKPLKKVLLMCFLLCAVGLGFILFKSTLQNAAFESSQTKVVEQVYEAVDIPALPANWYTYTNESFSYEIGLPIEYPEPKPTPFVDPATKNLVLTYFSAPADSEFNGVFTIAISVDTVASGFCYMIGCDEPHEQVLINGTVWNRYQIPAQVYGNDGRTGVVYRVVHREYLYNVLFENEDRVIPILETFVFTD